MKVLLGAAEVCCGVFVTVNCVFAQTWTLTSAPTNLNWSAVASSADGSRLIAAAYNSLWTSTNSGLTWASNTIPSSSGIGVVSSANGDRLVAVATTYSTNIMYTSTDSGTTWMSNNIIPSCHSLASSADGQKLLVAGGTVWTSTNAGSSWVSNNPPGGCISAASSSDGSTLIVGCYVGHIYVSRNSGISWQANGSPGGIFWSLACSADGTTIFAGNSADHSYTSTNSGLTWMANNFPGTYFASSADGTKLVAGGAYIYTSTNSGTTWVSNNFPRAGYLVASSADGNKLVVAGNTGIYTSYAAPTPQLNIKSSGGNLALSWLVPSTNFGLQQNDNLTTANWVTLTNTPVLNLTNLQDEVVLSPTNSSGFFRLKSQ
jgi:hypothetical protein